MDLSRMVAAGTDLEVDGKIYTLSPLTLRDLGEFQRWAADRPFEELRRKFALIGDLLTPSARDLLIVAADTESRNYARSAAMLESIAGLERLVKASLTKKHPGITDDEVGRIVMAVGREKLQARLDAVSNLTADELKNSPAGGDPAK